MKINKIVFTLLLGLGVLSSYAQETRESVVFKAMRDEASRTKTMTMGRMPSPFFFNYYIQDTRSLGIVSQYGSTISVNKDNGSTSVGAEIYIGSEQASNKLDFSGTINSFAGTHDNDYLSLRTSLWNITDALYKNSMQEYQVKFGAMQQMTLSAEEKKMKDFVTIAPVKNSDNIASTVEFDEKKWVDICNKLSDIYKNYPDLRNTKVTYNSVEKTFFIFNNKGTEIQQRVSYVNISSSATLQDENGVVMNDAMSIFSTQDGELPNEEKLVSRINNFAKKMSGLKSIPSIEEYYNGPVLFVGGAVRNIFISNLLSDQSGIIASKGLTKSGWSFNPLERRIGRKVLDTKLSIKNYSSLKEYAGTKLIGGYSVDVDGVKPASELA